jgi:hypothetical protein
MMTKLEELKQKLDAFLVENNAELEVICGYDSPIELFLNIVKDGMVIESDQLAVSVEDNLYYTGKTEGELKINPTMAWTCSKCMCTFYDYEINASIHYNHCKPVKEEKGGGE